jgi:hypothetical protein
MSDGLRANIQRQVSREHNCGTSHTGTFFVEEQIDGGLATVAVEIFQLRGHPRAEQAFAWSWIERGERRYVAVLRVPPIDSPAAAVRLAIAGRDQGSYATAVSRSEFNMVVTPAPATKNAEYNFEFLPGYTVFRPMGNMSFYDATGIVAESLSFATFLCVNRLLVNATTLTGFPSPNTWQRFWMATQWASIARGLRLAVVARPELIDAERFGITVARNRGLFANVFTSEAEAIAWLLDHQPT